MKKHLLLYQIPAGEMRPLITVKGKMTVEIHCDKHSTGTLKFFIENPVSTGVGTYNEIFYPTKKKHLKKQNLKHVFYGIPVFFYNDCKDMKSSVFVNLL